jgi:predicted O-methyltransferase YrrM
MGAAFGETAAILAETASSVVTVERDPERIEVARERLAEIPDVELLDGDAFELLRGRGPFGLVFVDGGLRPVTEEKWEAILALVEPGGILVKDDMSPGRPVEGDEVREFLLRDPRLAAAEILATPEMAVIVAVRLR